MTSADVKLTKSGVVSLAAAKSLVRRVTCYEDATVAIRMAQSIDNSMESLFPIGAILVISSEVFGPCTLFPTNCILPTRAAFAGTSDSYLCILSRTGTPQNAILTGQAVTLLSLFDAAKIMARRVDPVEDDVPGSERRLARTDSASKEWWLDEPQKKVKLGVSLEGTSRCSIDAFVLEKGDVGWERVLEAVIDIEMKLEGSIIMCKGLEWKYPAEGQEPAERELAEVPIYAISMSALKKLARLVNLDLPEVRAGILLEALVGYEVDAKVEAKLGPTLTT